MGQSKIGTSSSKGRLASAVSFSLAYYPGSRRLPNLPDGREVWQAYVDGFWRTYYELPLDGTALSKIRDRLAAAMVRVRQPRLAGLLE
jgi:hypothetical protein